jgi:CMP/dCMP kinase
MIVTIDGPAGTGKSTAARLLADELGFQYLDTGAMYRMVALESERQQVDPREARAVAELTASLHIDFNDGRALLNGNDVSRQLRSAEVSRRASVVAQNPHVREILVRRQRELARQRNIVCEGRDQGTVVFPDAECKFFVTADPEVRARRRMLDLQSQGHEVDFDDLLREQSERDGRDQTRAIAPLKPAPDALIVDTTRLSIDEVVGVLKSHVEERIGKTGPESNGKRSPLVSNS